MKKDGVTNTIPMEIAANYKQSQNKKHKPIKRDSELHSVKKKMANERKTHHNAIIVEITRL